MLKVEKLNAGYGSTRILFDIDLKLMRGEIVVVLGANGAGKSTLMNAISGMCTIQGGRVTFDGQDITGWKAHRIVGSGLAQCPEGRQIFQRLTVEENLQAAFIDRGRKSFAEIRDEVYDLFPVLRERRHSLASRMSGGQQQMLAIGRSLMAQPSVILLDEPSLGLAPKLIHQIFEIVLDLAKKDISVVLVEQNVRLALEVGDYAYVLESGHCRLEGGAAKLMSDPSLAELYLAGHSHLEASNAPAH